MKQKKILMIGQGAFATAISNLLTINGHCVIMLCQEEVIAHEINQKKTNHLYYPECLELKNIIGITTKELKNYSYDLIFQSIPIPFLEKVLLECKPYIDQEIAWVSLSKGINNQGLSGSSIIKKIINPISISVLSGPSFATLINKKDYTGVMIASTEQNNQICISKIMSTSFLKVYYTNDIYGLELVGAAKNILAIFIGLLESLSYYDNARAFFFTKSIEQLNTAIVRFGGKQATMFDLGGIGDIFLTCSGNASKNKTFGKTLGLHTFIKKDFFLTKNYMCEGIETTKAFKNLLNAHGLSLSIFESLYAILYQEAPIQKTITDLFQSF